MSAPEHLFFYHGTTKTNIFGIMQNGLASGYLTQCRDQARYYAEVACDVEKESSGKDDEPAILLIKVPVSHLKVDFPSIEEPLRLVREKHDIRSEEDFFEALDEDEYGWPENESDWQRSLFLTDCVYFDGNQEVLGEVMYDKSPIGFSDFEIDYPDLELSEEGA